MLLHPSFLQKRRLCFKNMEFSTTNSGGLLFVPSDGDTVSFSVVAVTIVHANLLVSSDSDLTAAAAVAAVAFWRLLAPAATRGVMSVMRCDVTRLDANVMVVR